MNKEKKSIIKLTGIASIIASLCCITPIIIVLLGISSVSFAAGLGNSLYYGYRWYFISVGIFFIITALYIHYRKKTHACPLDKKKREKQKLVNLILLSIPIFVTIYLIFNYIILEFVGYGLGLWDLPKIYKEIL